MTETKYIVKTTTQFKKDYKLAIKRGLKIDLLKDIIAVLAMGEKLPTLAKASWKGKGRWGTGGLPPAQSFNKQGC